MVICCTLQVQQEATGHSSQEHDGLFFTGGLYPPHHSTLWPKVDRPALHGIVFLHNFSIASNHIFRYNVLFLFFLLKLCHRLIRRLIPLMQMQDLISFYKVDSHKPLHFKTILTARLKKPVQAAVQTLQVSAETLNVCPWPLQAPHDRSASPASQGESVQHVRQRLSHLSGQWRHRHQHSQQQRRGECAGARQTLPWTEYEMNKKC